MAAEKIMETTVGKFFLIVLLALVLARFAGDAVQGYFDKRAIGA